MPHDVLTNKVAFVVSCIDAAALEGLYVVDDLDARRYVLINPVSDQEGTIRLLYSRYSKRWQFVLKPKSGMNRVLAFSIQSDGATPWSCNEWVLRLSESEERRVSIEFSLEKAAKANMSTAKHDDESVSAVRASQAMASMCPIFNDTAVRVLLCIHGLLPTALVVDPMSASAVSIARGLERVIAWSLGTLPSRVSIKAVPQKTSGTNHSHGLQVSSMCSTLELVLQPRIAAFERESKSIASLLTELDRQISVQTGFYGTLGTSSLKRGIPDEEPVASSVLARCIGIKIIGNLEPVAVKPSVGVKPSLGLPKVPSLSPKVPPLSLSVLPTKHSAQARNSLYASTLEGAAFAEFQPR